MKNEGNYRIPVKVDPDIVIKYIKASHELLAEVVGSRGGIKVGGMYGILPINNDLKSASFQITIKGFIGAIQLKILRKRLTAGLCFKFGWHARINVNNTTHGVTCIQG